LAAERLWNLRVGVPAMLGGEGEAPLQLVDCVRLRLRIALPFV
jgi:hypothetical protein